MRYLLALDEGTTSARALCTTRKAGRLAIESRPIITGTPFRVGWSRMRINFSEVSWTQRKALLARRNVEASEIAASASRIKGKHGRWDRSRTACGARNQLAVPADCGFLHGLAASENAADITNKTGLVIDAYFSGSKIRWILDNVARGSGISS